MASLSLKHIYKVYDGNVKAVNDFSMEIADKEFIVFVGPSGCGKSTTLRMIAGLEDITAGELSIDGKVVNSLEPKDRNIAMVFQNYALYPHMTVYENMAFPLRMAHMKKDEIDQKVRQAAEILGIGEYLERKPKALSGGQRQRVALGRAIVRNPKVFLLDEPLSNLDAKLRATMREEISRLYERLGTTFIYVTHDQIEAMTMGDRIVVMRAGVIMQIDSPMNLYKYPENVFVAGFIGTPRMNFLDARLFSRDKRDEIFETVETVEIRLDVGGTVVCERAALDKIPPQYFDGERRVVVGARPEDIVITACDTNGSVCASVAQIEALGGESLVYAALGEGGERVSVKCDADRTPTRGEKVGLLFDVSRLHFFDKDTEVSIRRPIPSENTLPCQIVDNTLLVGMRKFLLPAALSCPDADELRLSLPTSAVRLGEGDAVASVARIEEYGTKRLVVLSFDGLTLFALSSEEHAPRVGESVKFDIDMRRISLSNGQITPFEGTNRLMCRLIKEKHGRKVDFYFEFTGTGGQRLTANGSLFNRLLATRSTEAFRIPLEMVFDAEATQMTKIKTEKTPSNKGIFGKVCKILDYTSHKYAMVDVDMVDISGATVVALCNIDLSVGDDVEVMIDTDRASIIDRELGIIIA